MTALRTAVQRGVRSLWTCPHAGSLSCGQQQLALRGGLGRTREITQHDFVNGGSCGPLDLFDQKPLRSYASRCAFTVALTQQP